MAQDFERNNRTGRSTERNETRDNSENRYSSTRQGRSRYGSDARQSNFSRNAATEETSKVPSRRNVASANTPLGNPLVQGEEVTVRINKALADAGVCSRRAADELIAQGAVSVNGFPVTSPGMKLRPGKDSLSVNGRKITIAAPATRNFTYLLMNKPIEIVTTVKDPEGRRTVIDLLPPFQRKKRLFPVGRLDFYSEGLLILTDDGDLTHRLTHPSWHLDKVYEVRLRGAVSDEALNTMRRGMTLAEGEELAPVEIFIRRHNEDQTVITMTLVQGINRQIRRMCRDLGLTILKLRRIRQGNLELGNLPSGTIRLLTPEEITELRASVGLE